MIGQSEQDRWNTRFAGEEYLFGTRPNAFLAGQQHLLKSGQQALKHRTQNWICTFGIDPMLSPYIRASFGRKTESTFPYDALAIADGEGRNGVWLAEQGLQVTAVDFSQVALDKARRLAESKGVDMTFVQADLATWEWKTGGFDVVAAIFIQFADPPLRAAIFRGIRRTLASRGLLLLQGYRPEQIRYGTGGPPHAENMYTAAMLRDAFSDFEIITLTEHDSEITEGQGHQGMSALVDLVARKPG